MAKVDGFNIAFSHRGAWKADLLPPGKPAQTVPVTWTKDWNRKEGTLFVWFKKSEEIDEYMMRSEGFPVAIAIKDPSGSASSNDIIGIFSATPQQRSDNPLGITCKIGKRLRPADF